MSTPPTPRTTTGTGRLVTVPSPRRPKELTPQVQTVRSAFIAILCELPAEILVTVVNPLTWTGIALDVKVPSPNSPELLTPHAQTVPSVFNARLCAVPAEI